MDAGAMRELQGAPAKKKMAAKCFAPERAPHLEPKVRAEKRTIRSPQSHVEEHVSKKTKTFLFSPSFLNCCARKSWVRGWKTNFMNLSHCLLRQKPAYGSRFLPSLSFRSPHEHKSGASVIIGLNVKKNAPV